MKTQTTQTNYPKFPVSLYAVNQFKFSSERLANDHTLFFTEYREFRFAAYKINQGRKESVADKDKGSLPYAKPSDLNATALINLIYFHLFKLFQKQIVPNFAEKLTTLLQTQFDETEQAKIISKIQSAFPYEGDLSNPEEFSNFFLRSIIIRLDNENPALNEYHDLFSDSELLKETPFQQLFKSFDTFFMGLPSFGDNSTSLLEFLREPFKRFPNSLYDQLAFIQKEWGVYIHDLLDSIISALDFLKEEYKPVFNGFGSEIQTPDYGLLNDEYEAFTDDRNWMPNVVMLAKSTLVWLDQLSKKYHYRIERLNQIPNKELDLIQSEGFNAIWLIGIWERSHSSQKIKHIYGNYDAEASAYSLFDYDIAEQLGGWEALEDLRKRCKQRGIRLASDMVPNHTGLDSRWMIEHPDRFLQLPYNPMPHYTFNGPNLSDRGDIGIYLEDKYYNKTDCAVVFKRVDFRTGEERYIYHGNDGTGLPWNDTAQIDYLNPEAREAVIQTILHVARNFSIIRFDAAMTLAKKHIQRLWYPAPGQGGDIPTRSEHAMSTADFNKALPQEFWREVVDRIAAEAPDTLLLAEAFWMLEGYFVRTLGMHRVYNSAFMHMLRDEKNDQYRYLIKETLEFDPQILKRYVNFMNNPDEDTAAEQFGKDDKYFGICVLLCTLPGLPMFGHGQIEGFYEKYGMEFRKALWNETPDEYLIARHQKEIFPLLHERYLYSEVHNFNLYDFKTFDNRLNENVFAYSNYTDTKNALIVYNNKYEGTSGNIFYAVPVKDKVTGEIKHNTILDFLYAVTDNPKDDDFIIFTEKKTSLDYIRTFKEIRENGLTCLLSGYEYQIFQNFRKIKDLNGSYSHMYHHLNGAGIYDLPFEANILKWKPYFRAAFNILSPSFLSLSYDFLESKTDTNLKEFIHHSCEQFKEEFTQIEGHEKFQTSVYKIISILEPSLINLCEYLSQLYLEKDRCSNRFLGLIAREQKIYSRTIPILIDWATVLSFKAVNENYYYELDLANFIKFMAKRYFKEPESINHMQSLVKLLQSIDENDNDIEFIVKDPFIINFAKINDYNNITWFDQTEMESLLVLRLYNQFLRTFFTKITQKKRNEQIESYYQEFLKYLDCLTDSEYQLNRFIELIKE